ncbi:MAG: cation:proton antiporter [Chloroflexota bacterium]|nr:cation:proton antiporter [Chloroflexota bacterium]
MSRNLIFYILTVVIFGSLVWFVLDQGAKLANEPSTPMIVEESHEEASLGKQIDAAAQKSAMFVLLKNFSQNTARPFSRLLLQIAVIIVVSRLLSFLVAKIGQPLVIGEITAGIILGPSLLGLFWPEMSNFLFPPDSLPNIEVLSQLGLILFMFIIGLELDVHLVKNKAQTAFVISHASIILPFFGGVSLAYFLYKTLAPPNISFLGFGLFMGIAMSITAFPVLARILQERGLTQSSLGVLAITSAAIGDVTAWCILAVMIAVVQAGTVTSALFTIVLSILYVLAMLGLVRPLLQHLAARYASVENLSRAFVVLAFVVLFLSAFVTEVLGIHALFGAFLAGVIMPAQIDFRKMLTAKIEDVSLVILLPLFFASTGLRTQIGLLNDSSAWLICGLIILVAVVGKVGGSLVAAKFTGQSWSESLVLGVLMNTRGLIELIVLSIGYDLGILSPTVYTMMVLMALVTTFMTSPALSAIQYFSRKRERMGVYPVPERT